MAVKVAVTGAAGQLAYALYTPLLSGALFGPDKPIYLHLLDIPPAMDTLRGLRPAGTSKRWAGVVLELEDCAFPLLRGILATDLVNICFQDADFVFLLGSVPRKPGQTVRDLLHANAKTFREQGEALERSAKKTVKILVVGHPCNTNAMICRHYAPSIPPASFTSLTRLYQHRAQFQVAVRLNDALASAHWTGDATAAPVHSTALQNVVVWGNHSTTVFPDLHQAVWVDGSGARHPVSSVLPNPDVDDGLVQALRGRGTAVLDARKVSAGLSGAAAVVRHVRDWTRGTAPGEIAIMGVASDGSYGIPAGMVLAMPVTCAGAGAVRIVPGLALDDITRAAIDRAVSDLESELVEAMSFLRDT